jgi:hypothetical protein
MNLREMTPREIDTILAGLHEEMWKAGDRVGRIEKARYETIHGREAYSARGGPRRGGILKSRAAGNLDGWLLSNRFSITDMGRRLNAAKAARVKAREAIEPYNEEFRRRPWLRYYLVTSSIGHVHRERDCSTCYFSTTYAWLVELADCDEAAMVAEYGTKACTVCFPDAPTLPGWAAAEKREAAELAEKNAGTCSNKRFEPGRMSDPNRYRRYGKCTACGTVASITTAGNLRKHKVEKAA